MAHGRAGRDSRARKTWRPFLTHWDCLNQMCWLVMYTNDYELAVLKRKRLHNSNFINHENDLLEIRIKPLLESKKSSLVNAKWIQNIDSSPVLIHSLVPLINVIPALENHTVWWEGELESSDLKCKCFGSGDRRTNVRRYGWSHKPGPREGRWVRDNTSLNKENDH